MLTQFLCTGARVRQLDRLIAAILGKLPATAFRSRRSSKGFDNNVQPFPAPGMLLGPFPRARTDAATKFSVVHQPLYRAAHPGNVTHIYEALTAGGAEAALAASIFHFGELSIASVKEGPMRILVAAKIGNTRLIDNIGV